MGDALGGHLVSGHVDGLAVLVDRAEENESIRLTFEVPDQFAPLIAPKGSVALNGVSLTVNEVTDNEVTDNGERPTLWRQHRAPHRRGHQPRRAKGGR